MIQILDAQKAAIVRLEGDLDIGTVEDLRPRLLEHLGNGIHHFVFDMKRARFMCSMGLGFLVDLYHGVKPYQGSVRLENVAPAIQKLLEATHLSRIFMDGEALNILNKPDETREAVSRQMGEEVHLQSILAEATGQILVAQRPEEIQDRALAAVLRGLHSEKGLLLSVEHRADGIHMLSLAASRGFAPEDLEEIRMVRLRFDSPDARFLREPQPRLLDPETRSQLMRASGLTQAIFAPIQGPQGLMAVLLAEVNDQTAQDFAQDALNIAVFTNICGLAIDKQRLSDKLQAKNARLAEALEELQQTQASLIEAGRMAVAGCLMQTIGRVLGDKLVPILGYAQMLGAEAGNDTEKNKKAKIIENSAMAIKSISDAMNRSLTREGLKIEEADIGEIMQKALYMAHPMLERAAIAIESRFKPGIELHAHVDSQRILQAFFALLQRLPTLMQDQSDPRLIIEIEARKMAVGVLLTDNGPSFQPYQAEFVRNPIDHPQGLFESDTLCFAIAQSVALATTVASTCARSAPTAVPRSKWCFLCIRRGNSADLRFIFAFFQEPLLVSPFPDRKPLHKFFQIMPPPIRLLI